MNFKKFFFKEALVSNRFRISIILLILLFTIGLGQKSFSQTTISTSGSYTQGALTLVLGSNPQHTIKFYSGNGTTGSVNRTDLSGISGAQQRWDISHRIDAGSHSGNHNYSVDFTYNFPAYGVSLSPGTASNYVLAHRTGTSGNWTAKVTGASAVNSTEVKFTAVNIDCNDDLYYALFSLDTTASPLLDPTAPLPVKLISFNGLILTNNKIQLNWITVSELNNDRFEIEKSINGHDFVLAGTVKGNGNSNQLIHYEFVDNEFNYEANIYYRLRQVDYDGDFEYSPIIILKQSTDLGVNPEIVIYPNPAIAGTNVILDLKNLGQYENTVIVSDIYGKIVYQVIFEKSDNILILDNLPTGLYTIMVNNRYGIRSRKFMVKN